MVMKTMKKFEAKVNLICMFCNNDDEPHPFLPNSIKGRDCDLVWAEVNGKFQAALICEKCFETRFGVSENGKSE